MAAVSSKATIRLEPISSVCLSPGAAHARSSGHPLWCELCRLLLGRESVRECSCASSGQHMPAAQPFHRLAAADTHTYTISLGHRTLRRARRDALLSSEAAAAADAAAAEEEMRLASEVRALPVSSLHARSDIPTRCTHPTRTQITLINTHPTRSLAPTHSIHTCLADSHHTPNITHTCAPLHANHTFSLTHAVATHTPRFLHENCNDCHRSLHNDHMQVFPLTIVTVLCTMITCKCFHSLMSH